METDLRAVLYLQPQPSDDCLADAIRARGWDVEIANCSAEAREIMHDRGLRVGLMQLPDAAEDLLREDGESLLGSGGDMNWVALLPRSSAGHPPLCRLIADYFYDYHTPPPDIDRLMATLGHAHGMARMVSYHRDQSQPENGVGPVGMVGRSCDMRRLFQQVQRFAGTEFSAIIRGESGTGKELVAQAMHRLSERAEQPFVAVNCGALPKELIQAELFGYEKGAFTGADARRIGRIEAAQGGTLFLDEIGDLPRDMQVNLLRFLQEKTVQRLGGSAQIPVDVRVIAATHVNLERAVAKGLFREDLYYRLNVLQLDVPPLRSRGTDIELLANHFLNEFSLSVRRNIKGFTPQALATINSYNWPGNVRELVNRVQRAVVMCEGKLIRLQDLAMDQNAPNTLLMTLAEARAVAERNAIEMTLRAERNNVSRAARHLGISRVTLYRLMEQHGIDWQNSRSS